MSDHDNNSLESQLNDIFSPGSSSNTSPVQNSPTAPGISGNSIIPPQPIQPTYVTQSSATSNNVVNLGELLEINGYHPVMIFGTRASGKSTLLASIFNYIRTSTDSKSIVLFGDPIVPLDNNYGLEVYDAAKEFFYNKVEDFMKGRAPAITQSKAPFFIPVIIRPSNGLPEIKLAFLESAGEWYMPNSNLAGLYQPLKEEIESVYRNFTQSITLLLVAPYTTQAAFTDLPQEEVDSEEIRDSDSGLYGSLEKYQSMRFETYRQKDNYRFILTKWDVHTGGDIYHPDLANPSPQLISLKIKERFPQSWVIFESMGDGNNKAVMPYSAGFIAVNDVIINPDDLRLQMLRFPRTLLDWIYGNVSGYSLYDQFHSKKGFPNNVLSFFKKLLS